MADDRFETDLSTHTPSSIALREKNLTTDVMGELGFPGALYYLWTGSDPTPAEVTVLDAMLTSLMVHGTTPSAIAARMTAHGEPEAMQAAVASGILGVGSGAVGTMQECAAELQSIAAAEYRDREIEQAVQGYRERGEQFPGLGHPRLRPVDPRAERLFEIGFTEGVAGEHVQMLQSVQSTFTATVGTELLVNVTGAIAALGLDMDLPPAALRGIGVISRAAGVTGEVLEEDERPMADDIWEFVDQRTVRSRDRNRE